MIDLHLSLIQLTTGYKTRILMVGSQYRESKLLLLLLSDYSYSYYRWATLLFLKMLEYLCKPADLIYSKSGFRDG